MISRIKINNYKSIQDVDFELSRLCALIGANNVGKSNILKALDILLGERWPGDQSFSKDDFYNRNTDLEIKISVWFNPALPYCSCKAKSSGIKESIRAKVFHLTHNQNGTFFEVESKEGRLYWGNSDVRQLASLIYIRADRNLEKQLSISEWTLLGKILKEADKEFRAGAKLGDTNLTQNESDLKDAMEGVLDILKRPARYKSLESSLIKNLREQTKDLLEDFVLEMKPYSPLHYYKTTQILGKEWENYFDVKDMGSGLQNLIILALFRTYAELEKENAILAIEEPEIYLHPHAERQLYKIFRELAYPIEGDNPGAQIIYATHSSNFVDLPNYNEIRLIKRDKENGSKVFQSEAGALNSSERESLKIITEFNQERNEIFFARKVLLVEGDTEKHALPRALRLKGVFIDNSGISIIETGGKGNFPFFIKILSSMGIPWIATYDLDSDFILSKQELEKTKKILSESVSNDEKRKARTKLEKNNEVLQRNKAINDIVNENEKDHLFALSPNFEKICGLPIPQDSWKKIKNARDKFDAYTKYEEIPLNLRNAIDKLLGLREILITTGDEDDGAEESAPVQEIPF